MRSTIDDLIRLSNDYIKIDEDLEDMKINLQRRQRRKTLAPEEKQRAEERIAEQDEQRNDLANQRDELFDRLRQRSREFPDLFAAAQFLLSASRQSL